MSNKNLDAARWYAARGLKSFPVTLNGTKKQPLKGSNGFYDATDNLGILQQWFDRRVPPAVGVRTGTESGVFVIDADPKNGGLETLYEMFGGPANLPETWQSETPSGGRHVWFKHPGIPIQCKVALLEGIDVRGDGGYVVAPPSIRPDGQCYRWLDDLRPGVCDLADAPEWLIEMVRLKAPDERGVSERVDRLAVLQGSSKGQRDSDLFKLASSLRATGIPEDEALVLMLTAADNAEETPDCGRADLRELAREKCARVYRTYPNGRASTSIIESVNEPLPPGAEALTDLGNAERMVRLFGQDLRYCHKFTKWLIWNGWHWTVDETGGAPVRQRAAESVRLMYAEAAGAPEHRKKALPKWAFQCESKARIEAMCDMMKSQPGIPVTPDELDANPLALALRNGTLDLSSGELRPSRREDLCSLYSPVEYDPETPPETWLKFLSETFGGDPSVIAFIQKALGYTLTGLTDEQVMFFCYGQGANGKSKLVETVAWIMGSYATALPADMLMAKAPASYVLNLMAGVPGKRLVTPGETEEGQWFAEQRVKDLTGEDRIKCKLLYAEAFEFIPQCKLWFRGNHKPKVGTGHAFWRRMRLIPFENVVPQEQQDRSLGDKLKLEAPSILAWLAQGCVQWMSEGLGCPEKVRAATDEYREEVDSFGDFIAEHMVQDNAAQVTVGDAFKRFDKWCTENHERSPNMRQFVQKLRDRGMKSESIGGHRKAIKGWRLNDGQMGLSEPEDPYADD